MNTIAVQLLNIKKEYIIHHEKPTLVEKFIRSNNERFIALHNINLTIAKGERIGIIGPNGSGKTTLLKIIAGITAPTKGSIKTQGNIVSLIDLQAGFHPDLSGYKNIFLNGLLLGMRKKEIEAKYRSIIEFADIHQFIDAPMFTYSSGMALRLGFAIAIHADPDILLFDEGLSVGDKNFQKKSSKKIQALMKKNLTVIIVSHQMTLIRKLCSRFVILQNGSILSDGPKSTLSRYGY